MSVKEWIGEAFLKLATIFKDEWEPPTKYCVEANGTRYFVCDYKPNPIYGIDVVWEEDDGRVVMGTIAEVSIFDYDSDMTLEKFANIKKATIDYQVQKATEAIAQQEELEQPAKPCSGEGYF